MKRKLAKDFRSFADLAAAYVRDRDYRISLQPRPELATAIVAPHGGAIEAHTSDIARELAGQDFSFYAFEGLLKAGNFAALRLPSHLFDEPDCMDLLAASDRVLTVHGGGRTDEVVLIGGSDLALRAAIAERVQAAGVSCEDALPEQDVVESDRLCNRGRAGAGVQLEVSLGLRQGARRALLIRAVREALLAA